MPWRIAGGEVRAQTGHRLLSAGRINLDIGDDAGAFQALKRASARIRLGRGRRDGRDRG